MESGQQNPISKKFLRKSKIREKESLFKRHAGWLIAGAIAIAVIIILAVVSLILQNSNNQTQKPAELNQTFNNDSKVDNIEVTDINCINSGDTGNSRYQAEYYGRIRNNLERTASRIIIHIAFLDSSGRIIGFEDNALTENIRAGQSRSFQGTAINLLGELSSCKASVEYS